VRSSSCHTGAVFISGVQGDYQAGRKAMWHAIVIGSGIGGLVAAATAGG
jgi:hypothetical protein